MPWTRNTTKTLWINIGLCLIVVGLLTIGPIIGIKTIKKYVEIRSSGNVDTLLQLPNYANIEWAEQYWSDHAKLRHQYTDYVSWLPKTLTTDTINIDEAGRRLTIYPKKVHTNEVWLFGGSTMWGFGVDDANTIASQLASLAEVSTINFGVNGFSSRQNVQRLIQAYSTLDNDKDESRTVVFYGGLNDAIYSCRTDKSVSATVSQISIRKAMENDQIIHEGSFQLILRPATVFLEEFMTVARASRLGGLFGSGSSKGEAGGLYGCHNDSELAELAAMNLVFNWRMAQGIVESQGDRFIAILQPVAALSESRLDHLPATPTLDEQYETMYPIFRQHLGNAGVQWSDFSTVLDRSEYIFIDDAHVTPNGNRYIAESLAELLILGVG